MYCSSTVASSTKFGKESKKEKKRKRFKKKRKREKDSKKKEKSDQKELSKSAKRYTRARRKYQSGDLLSGFTSFCRHRLSFSLGLYHMFSTRT